MRARRITVSLAALAALGQLLALLQLASMLPDFGPWAALPPGVLWPRLLLGGVMWLLAALPATAALEGALLRSKRSPWLALLGLTGPLAVLLTLRLTLGRPDTVDAPPPPSPARRPWPQRLGGALACAALLAGLGWTLSWWTAGASSPAPASADELRGNERLAWQRLARIGPAQEAFRRQDWDGDGALTYASFVVHLHSVPARSGVPQRTGLLERQLAFAMAPTRALDGYYFHDLHEETPQPRPPGWDGSYRSLDPAREWAIVALPARYGATGRLALLARSGGRIYARDLQGAPLGLCPADPLAAGWMSVRSPADLAPVREVAGAMVP